jgi:NAD(P) transhydrogenase
MNGTNSSAKHYDMVVIGLGPAGHHGAIQAAKLGKRLRWSNAL